MRASLANLFLYLARLAFALTIVLTPFRLNQVIWAHDIPPLYSNYTNYLLFASDVVLVATLVAWLVSLALQPRRVHSGTDWIFIPLLGLTLVSLLSAFFSIDPFVSFYQVMRLGLMLGLYLFAANEIRSLGSLIMPVTLQGALQSVVGIAQFAEQHSIGLARWGELVLDPAQSVISVVVADGIRTLRAYGLTEHPNILGGCLAFGLLLLIGWYCERAEQPRGTLLIGVIVLDALALFVSFSRAAWFAFALGMLFIAILFWRTRQMRLFGNQFVVASVALMVLLPLVWQNLPNLDVRFSLNATNGANRIEARSVDERAALNHMANEIFANHALWGIGLNALPIAMLDTYKKFPYDFQPAHFVLLDVAAETGILGALFYVILLSAPWLALWVNRRRLVWSPALITISAVLLAVYIIGMFDYYTWFHEPGRLWQWLAWGAWAGIYRAAHVPDSRT